MFVKLFTKLSYLNVTAWIGLLFVSTFLNLTEYFPSLSLLGIVRLILWTFSSVPSIASVTKLALMSTVEPSFKAIPESVTSVSSLIIDAVVDLAVEIPCPESVILFTTNFLKK